MKKLLSVFMALLCLNIYVFPMEKEVKAGAGTKYVYLDIGGAGIFTTSISLVPKESEIIYENGVISYKRPKDIKKDAYVSINMNGDINSSDKYVIEVDFYVSTLKGTFTFPREYSGSTYESNVITIDSNMSLKGGGKNICTLSKNTLYNIKIVTDKKQLTKTIYINDVIKGSYSYVDFEGTTYRSGLASYSGTDGESNLYIKDLRVYDYEENFSTEGFEICRYSVMETDKKAHNLIDGANVFSDFDTIYFGGEKKKLSSMGYDAYRDNNILYVPVYPIATVYEKSYSINGKTAVLDGYTFNEGSETVGGSNIKLENKPQYKNGLLYLPVYEVVTKLFGKYGYSDVRGFDMFSDKEITFSNSVSSFEIKEPIDTVYRFLKFDRPNGTEILSDIRSDRPRVITNKESLNEVIELCKNDTFTQRWEKDVLSDADAALTTALVEYNISDGTRLLSAARSVLNVVTKLSTGYLLTGDKKYAERCWEQMENALLWKDWNANRHYLDCSELSYAMAIGFDCIYDTLTKEQKNLCIQKTLEHSLLNSVGAYQGTFKIGSEWRYATGNWGAVCPGGIIAACVSFAGEDYEGLHDITAFLLGQAIRSLEYPLMLFYPDGAWSEGTGYWSYTVQYLFGAAAGSLYHSTGKTYSLVDAPGVNQTLDSIMYLQSDEGAFNYADTGTGKISSPEGYLLSHILGDDARHKAWDDMKNKISRTGSALALLWRRPVNAETSPLPTDKYFYSAEAGAMKHCFDDEECMYVGIKGGQNHTNHDNLDLGNFIFDSLGERWAIELGSDDYNIEGGYWGLVGYELYKKRPEGQNCLVINPRPDVEGEYYGGQYLDAYAPLCQFESKEKGAYMVLDLSDAYKFDVSDYKRGFFLTNNRNEFIVQDEIKLLENNSDMLWFMHTRADVDISDDGKSAYLVQNGKKIYAQVISNADSYAFELRNTDRLETSPIREGENSRAGINKLTVKAEGSGEVYIAVKFSPVEGEENAEELSYTPISDWTIENGRIEKSIKFLNVNHMNVYNSDSTFNVSAKIPYDFDKAELLIDGTIYGIKENGKAGEVEFVVEKGDINVGIKSVQIKVDYADGSFDETELLKVSFVDFVRKELDRIDFEQCTKGMTKEQIISKENLRALSDQNGSAISIVDDALNNNTKVFKMTLTKSVSSGKPYIRGKHALQENAVVYTSFDIMFDNVFADVAFEPRESDNAYGQLNGSAVTSIFTRGGKIGGSDEIYSANKWYNVLLCFDMVNDIYFVSVDGKKVTSGSLVLNDYLFWSLNLGSTSGSGINYYLDNFVTYSDTPGVSLGDVSFVSGSEEKALDKDTKLIPANAEKLIVDIVNDTGVAEGDFTLKINRRELDCDVKISDGKAYITPLDEIAENSELFIYFRGVECVKMFTSKDGTLYVTTQAYSDYGMIDAISAGGSKILYTAVSYDDDENIIDVQITRKTLKKGEYSEKLSVGATGAKVIKVFVFGDGLVPVSESVYYN